MDEEKKILLEIGLDLNAIAQLLCEDCYGTVKERLNHLEHLTLKLYNQNKEVPDGGDKRAE